MPRCSPCRWSPRYLRPRGLLTSGRMRRRRRRARRHGWGSPGFFRGSPGSGHVALPMPWERESMCIACRLRWRRFGEGGSGVSGGDGASVPVHIKCEAGSRTLWFPRATIKVTGSEATVVCGAFDSASGEQVAASHVQAWIFTQTGWPVSSQLSPSCRSCGSANLALTTVASAEARCGPVGHSPRTQARLRWRGRLYGCYRIDINFFRIVRILQLIKSFPI